METSSESQSGEMQERPEDIGPESQVGVPTWLLVVLAALGLLAVYLLFFNDDGGGPESEVEHAAIGTQFDQLELEPLIDVDSPTGLDDVARRKATLVNFWGPWCYPCIVEMPHLVELYDSYHGDDRFALLFVSCGQSFAPANVESLKSDTQAVLKRLDASVPVYHDPQATSRLALVKVAQLQSFGYPTTVLLDSQGKVRGLWIGYAPQAIKEMKASISKLLAEE